MRPTVHIVPHTHWDREWYRPAARFQLRLARLTERVLDLLERGALPSFLLDGQGIVLDDVLAVRPDLAPRLRRQFAAGRIEAGPWYVLADNLLVSGEAMVRNLLEGGRTARRHGGKPMAVGYAPDAFGHPAALPTILAGFGIETAVTWRGFGGERGQDRDLWRWRGPDGAEVLMVHLPRPGYEYGANLPTSPREAKRRWAELQALLSSRAVSPHWLVMNGADHHAAQADVKAAARALAAANADCRLPIADCRFVVGSLADYMRPVQAWARRNPGAIADIAGELRDGRRHAWALQGTHGTRLYLKQRNAECQRLLERVAEPLAALAMLPSRTRADLRQELRHGWRTLLENHPHDSICGTSADEVHREMVTRFERARALAIETSERALDAITGRDADAARVAGRSAWRPHLVVFNTLPRAGARLVEAEVALFRADVPVGPASAGRRPKVRQPKGLALTDARGRVVPFQELSRDVADDLVEAPGHYPDCDSVEWHRVLFMADDLPPLGVTHLKVAEGRTSHAPRTTHHVQVSDTSLMNEFVALRVESDGSLAILDRKTTESYHGLGVLVDERDVGDSYTAAPRERLTSDPDHVAVSVVHSGPLRGVLEVVRRFDAADLEVTMRVALEAGSGTIALEFEGVNITFDHRLRVAFPTGLTSPVVLADGAFGAVTRGTDVPRPRKGDTETATPTAPMQRWVAAARGRRGLAVITDGLPQYEARPDGTLLVTLLRATGALSKPDLPERPGHAGWPVPAVEGQCIGPFTGRLAVMMTGEAELATPDVFDAAADAALVPPVARMQRASLAAPRRQPGPKLTGEGLVFSAMKPAESGRGVILRCYNCRGDVVRGAWVVPWPVQSVRRCRLDETPVSALRVARGGLIAFEAGPREIVTILVRP